MIDFDQVAASLSPWSFDAPRVAVDYASGSHHRGEILGLARAGVPIGVSAVVELREDSVAALESLAGTGLPIFLDSGAFAEVGAFGKIKKPITDRHWKAKLALYLRLASALGSQLSVVAPDRVGDQGVTLEHMRRYRGAVRRVAALGARVLVPVQRGAVSAPRFFAMQRETLGLPDAVPAIPMTRKAGVTAQDVGAFVRRTGVDEIHLLGIGGKSRVLGGVLAAVFAVCPDCRVTIDSNKLVSLRVRSGGPGDPRARRPGFFSGKTWGDPVQGEDTRRIGTIETDRAAAELEEQAWGGGAGPDYTDLIGQPSQWLSRKRLGDVARWMDLPAAEREAFVADPDGWLQVDRRYELPWVTDALDRAWTRYFFEQTGVQRKEAATAATMERLRSGSVGEEPRVALVSCSASKLDRPAPARDLYSPSPLFRGASGWAEARELPWFVLSARYGLVDPDRVIEPYEQRLPAGLQGRQVRLRWAQGVTQGLYEQLGDLQGIVFEIHAGRDYINPLKRLLERQGATVELPMAGMQIGQRLSWYKRALR